MNKKLIVAIILVVAALGYFFNPFKSAVTAPPDFAMPVQAVPVEARPLSVTLDAVGSVRANESVVLQPEVAGRVTEITFVEGQPVKAGDPLFKIDDRMAAAEVKQAEANLQLARLDFERFRKLSKTGASTKQRYDQAQANLGVMEATLQLARTRLDYTTIRAPFDGVVGLRKISPGDYVNIGQELANFVSLDPMKVDFTIPETQASQLKIGQQLEITLEAIPGEHFVGELYAVDSEVDVNGRAVALRAMVPNPDGKLRPGYFARIVLTVAEKEHALIVPENAVVPQGNDKLVYVVNEDGTVDMRPVTLGQRLSGEVEILTGVKAGEQVMTGGHIKIRPGAKVMILPPEGAAAPDAAAAPEAAGFAPAEEAEVTAEDDAEAAPAAEEPATEEKKD